MGIQFSYVLISISIIAVGLLIIITGKTVATASSEHFSLIVGIVGIVATITTGFISKRKDDQEKARKITDFGQLHSAMKKEMGRILNRDGVADEHLYILSFTPAFGNISAPESYNEYKELLEDIVEKDIDIKLVCYNKNKRREYHEKWAEIKKLNGSLAEDDMAIQINEWEEQAKDIISIVQRGRGVVIEVDHIHPILFFSSSNILIQYIMKMPPKDGKESQSMVLGNILPKNEGNSFFYQAFKEHDEYYVPKEIIRLYEKHFDNEKYKEYIEYAQNVKALLQGRAVEKRTGINKINVLLAYGGGKDSTMTLIFLKYIQELLLKDRIEPFKLHILIHVHPGMRAGVFENINNIFKRLNLRGDNNVSINYRTKHGTLDSKSEISSSSIRSEHSDILQEGFRRELLLFGHLSRGLGRHTFCYTCNIDMIMAIINYVRTSRSAIDFIVTGDSKEEKSIYTEWINQAFSFGEKSSVDISRYNTKSFFDRFINLKDSFKKAYGIEIHETFPTLTNRVSYPELFNVHDYLEFSLSEYEELLKELGFKFYDDSFNFSETDCFYPAIMAHMAGLRGRISGSANYNEYLHKHLEHVKGIMEDKNFPNYLIRKAGKSITDETDKKVAEINKFLKAFGISEKQFEAMVYSPFLEDGKQLQSFLNERKIPLNSSAIIAFINDDEAVHLDKEEKKRIVEFIRNWIGINYYEDIKTIMSYPEKPNEDTELLERIARHDPYNNFDDYQVNGETIIISGR